MDWTSWTQRAELVVDWSSRLRDIKTFLRVIQAQIEIKCCVRGGLDLLKTTRWVRGRLEQSFPRYQTFPRSNASSDWDNMLLQSTSDSARCVQEVQSTSNAACYLNLSLDSLWGNVWYLGNDCSNRPLTQRVVLRRSIPPLTQHVISIWALHHSHARFDISETTAPITSNSARCVQEVQSTSNAACYLNLSLHH